MFKLVNPHRGRDLKLLLFEADSLASEKQRAA